MNPRTLLTTALLTTLLASGTAAQAAATTPTPPSAQSTRLHTIQTKGDADITARLTALHTLLTKIDTITKLSADQKTNLKDEVQGQISSLTALQTTLDAETDPTKAKADFTAIFQDHYIFAFYLPRIERIVAAEGSKDAADQLTAVATNLSTFLTQAAQQGSNVTALQTSLADMQSKTSDASTQAQKVLDQLIPLTASGYPANKATLTSATATLKTSREDLRAARKDADTILVGLKRINKSIQ